MHTDEDNEARNQQRNWETIMQLLTLRTGIHDIEYNGVDNNDLTEHNFGREYSGEHKVWSFTFASDDDYFHNNDRYGIIKNDIQNTPIIPDLTESVPLPEKFFVASGSTMNIYLKSINKAK
jgi:hypothetical protein